MPTMDYVMSEDEEKLQIVLTAGEEIDLETGVSEEQLFEEIWQRLRQKGIVKIELRERREGMQMVLEFRKAPPAIATDREYKRPAVLEGGSDD